MDYRYFSIHVLLPEWICSCIAPLPSDEHWNQNIEANCRCLMSNALPTPLLDPIDHCPTIRYPILLRSKIDLLLYLPWSNIALVLRHLERAHNSIQIQAAP